VHWRLAEELKQGLSIIRSSLSDQHALVAAGVGTLQSPS
jgi:hypothetical protein